MQKDNKGWLFIPSAVILLLAITGVLLCVFPVLVQAFVNKDAALLQDYLLSFGWRGIAITFVLQILQIVSVVIPAPTMPLLTGATYGLWPGLLISVAGIVCGNMLVFVTARRFSVRSLPKFLMRHIHLHDTGLEIGQTLPDETAAAGLDKQLTKLEQKYGSVFTKDSKKLGAILFAVYLIPVIPNGIIPYLAAMTPISVKRYMLVVAFACLPSALLSGFAGHKLIGGDITTTAILAGAALLAMGAIVLLRKRILARLQKMSEKD